MPLYQNRAIETAEVIQELIEIARELRQAKERGEDLGLSEDEMTFYDALGTNDSAVHALGDEVLKKIVLELTETVRANDTLDWTLKESARANLRRMVKRLLAKYGYPPDKTEEATVTVIAQAELMSKGMTAIA